MMVFQGFSLLIAGREMADCFNILFFILSGEGRKIKKGS